MSEHTPLPWRFNVGDIESESALEVIAVVNDVNNDNWEANAALIVEAVNNYETIRAELDAAELKINQLELLVNTKDDVISILRSDIKQRVEEATP